MILSRCGLKALAALVVVGLSLPSYVSPENRVALEQPEAEHRVTGTLAKLDIAGGKGVLMTDLEKPIFFRLDRPELFERLSIGDRVTMQLDDEGLVLKVIETLPAEVHEPPPPAK
ncbi:MAG TPA: hypothetical protein VFO04_01185 [Nitrospira sp.]|nr:hypothetical protein [Nitrospira sp.]